MKKTMVVTAALAFLLLSAGAALAGIAGGKHDMRTHFLGGFSGGYDEVCVYCHTPHSASSDAQLWNHTGSTQSFTTYTNTYGTLDATIGQPGAASMLCLSCHDGTVGVDALFNAPNYGNRAGTAKSILTDNTTEWVLNNTSPAYFDANISTDHPIGFVYNQTLADADGSLVLASTVAGSTYVRLAAGDTVECSTCHDAHNTTNNPFLRSSNAGSALCLRCHVK